MHVQDQADLKVFIQTNHLRRAKGHGRTIVAVDCIFEALFSKPITFPAHHYVV